MSDFNEIFETKIRDAVKEEVGKVLEPLSILADFSHVDQLTIDEVCKVFRREATEASKNWIRDGCKRGEIPHVKIGDSYLFPKRQIVLLLCGEWKPERKEKKRRSNYDLSAIAEEFVG